MAADMELAEAGDDGAGAAPGEVGRAWGAAEEAEVVATGGEMVPTGPGREGELEAQDSGVSLNGARLRDEVSHKFKGWESNSNASFRSTMSGRVWREYSGEDLQKKLFAAACTNNLRAIAKLTSKPGIHVNAAMERGQRVLFGAAYYGHLDAIKALFNLGADAKATDDLQVTALHYACMSGKSPEVVEALLGAGADPNALDKQGSSPLMLAVAHDSGAGRECVLKLLQAGASADGPDGRKQTLLHYVIKLRDDPLLITDLLELGSADPCIYDEAGNLPIHAAVDLNRVESIKRMVAAELSLSSSNVSGTSSFVRSSRAGLTVLHIAALHGNTLLCEFLAALLSDKRALLNRVDNQGNTPLHIAAAEGHLGCVQALKSCGTSPDVINNKGLTALHLAMAKQSVEIVEEILCGKGPKPDLTVKLPGSRTPYLHFLAQTGLEELTTEFVSRGAPLNDLDSQSRSALHVMAYYGSDKGCRALVELGLSPAAEDRDGKLPMHCAAMGGQADALQFLLQHGANMQPYPINLDERTHSGRDLLFVAALAGKAMVLAMLLDMDMGDMKDKVDRDGRSALHAAAIGGDPDCAALLVDGGWNVDAPDYRGFTPLFLAAQHGKTLVMRLLLDAGASVLVKSKASESPLHVAAKYDNVEGVICLVEAGHEVDTPDATQRTPCHEAAYRGSMLAGIALVRLGANIEAKEAYGLTPIAAAVSNGHRRLAKALEDEACRSADFHQREYLDAAYRIAGPAPTQGLQDDIDDVPPMVGTRPPPSRESVRPGVSEEDSAIMRAMSPLSGARRRRSSTAASYEDDKLSRQTSRTDLPHLAEEGSEDTFGDFEARRGGRPGPVGDLTLSNPEESGSDDEDMDPKIRHVLRKMEANLAGKELEDDAVSLGSSLGSDYQFQDEGVLAEAPAKQTATATAGK